MGMQRLIASYTDASNNFELINSYYGAGINNNVGAIMYHNDTPIGLMPENFGVQFPGGQLWVVKNKSWYQLK